MGLKPSFYKHHSGVNSLINYFHRTPQSQPSKTLILHRSSYVTLFILSYQSTPTNSRTIQFSTLTNLAFIALSTTTHASPINETSLSARDLVGWGYATFYDDTACQINPSQAFSIGNDGCIGNQFGRNSIYIQPGQNEDDLGLIASMVWTPNPECSCQNECQNLPTPPNGHDNFCWTLSGNAFAESFRFIKQGCDSNNC